MRAQWSMTVLLGWCLAWSTAAKTFLQRLSYHQSIDNLSRSPHSQPGAIQHKTETSSLHQLNLTACSAGQHSTPTATNSHESSAPSTFENASRTDACQHCSRIHQGVLRRITDPDNLAEGCFVYAKLHCNTFELARGENIIINQFDVPAMIAPIVFLPESHLCFIVTAAGNDTPEILCSENLQCRNEWWKALTRAILCSHQGESMRHEIAGEPIIEEEEEMVVEKAVAKPEKGGLNIKLSDISEMPIVKVKKRKTG